MSSDKYLKKLWYSCESDTDNPLSTWHLFKRFICHTFFAKRQFQEGVVYLREIYALFELGTHQGRSQQALNSMTVHRIEATLK